MLLSEIKPILEKSQEIAFELPNGELVPRHFHVTEVGHIHKHFIDCGGVIRKEEVISFQLWSADDYDHRLHPDKLLHIINLSESKLDLSDLPIEVEYQGETIGKYGLEYNGKHFMLVSKHTDCLARTECGIPEVKTSRPLASLKAKETCTPGGGCC